MSKHVLQDGHCVVGLRCVCMRQIKAGAPCSQPPRSSSEPPRSSSEPFGAAPTPRLSAVPHAI